MELRIDRLTKLYGKKLAVDRMDFTMKTGVYGLLGANGAGKTTLMRMICDVLKPTSGQILCGGRPISEMGDEYRSMLGYLPQQFGYYPEFTAEKFMMYMASLKGLLRGQASARTLQLLDLVGLSDVKGKKIRTFSGGMKQRLGIAQAMLNEPEILILDEPTSGLDPKERVRFRNLISSLARDKTVLLSTHIVSDIEYIANEILVMKEGRLIHQGRPEAVTKEIDGYVWECRVPIREADHWSAEYTVGNLRNEGDTAILRIISEKRPSDGAVAVEPGLEDLYLYYFCNEEENHGTADSI